MLNTLFFGTPETAVPFLTCLAKNSRVLGVVCSPDRPAGRGYHPAPPPVKTAALSLNLPVIQPVDLRDPAHQDLVRQWGQVDLGIVVAYGYKIPPAVFTFPRLGLVNVHFSLLPKYRGAAPIQRALMAGETQTGVSLFQIEQGLDTGPIFMQQALAVDAQENALSLREKLIALGVELLQKSVKRFEGSPWTPSPQAGEPTVAPSLKKEEGLLRWENLTARQAVDLIRGTYEWPHAFTYIEGQLLKIRQAEVQKGGDGAPGTVTALAPGKGFLVKCKQDSLLALRVQPEGKKEMDAWSYWNGARLKLGFRFDSNKEGEK